MYHIQYVKLTQGTYELFFDISFGTRHKDTKFQ
jgi:hypothetical protein